MQNELNPQQILKDGAAHHKSGNFPAAEECFSKFLELVPNEPRVMNYLGMAKNDQGKTDEAIGIFKQVITSNPELPNSYTNLGRAYNRKSMFEDAKECFSKAVNLEPNNFVTQYNYGNSLYHFGEYEQAEKYYVNAIKLNPNFATAYVNLGVTIVKAERFEEAENACLKAIQLDPNFQLAYESLGEIYEYQMKFEKMIAIYEKLLQIAPDHPHATCQLVLLYQYMCEWEKWAEFKEKAKKINEELFAADKPTPMKPFVSIMSDDNPEMNLKVAQSSFKEITEKVSEIDCSFSFQDRQRDKGKLTIGYISYDMRNHALGNNIQYLFAEHDRNKFEIHIYATNKDDGNETRKVIEKGADKFIDCFGMNEKEIATTIYNNEVDILVDLTGPMSGGRLKVMALRPAPIQVNYLGYLGTIGADCYDYIIMDEIVAPKEHQKFYSEKLSYVPTTLYVNHQHEEISEEDLTKKDFGLPEDAFVFNAHHSSYKIDPVIFDVWMKLLKQVEGSVLWLRDCGERPKKNLQNYAEKAGIDPNRLYFSSKISRAKYYKRLQIMDLGLDTILYNGGSTTMDSLWAGLPIISVLGNHYASRAGASIINGVDMYDDLVVKNLEEYEKLALELANNPERLKALKDKLWDNRTHSRLFDPKVCAKNMEDAYQQMWRET